MKLAPSTANLIGVFLFFIENEVYFSDGHDITVMGIFDGKVHRKLKGVSYPLAVDDKELYTFQNDRVLLVNKLNGQKSLIAYLGNRHFFYDDTTAYINMVSVKHPMISNFAASNHIIYIGYTFNGPQGGIAISIPQKKILWSKTSSDVNKGFFYGSGLLLGKYILGQRESDLVASLDNGNIINDSRARIQNLYGYKYIDVLVAETNNGLKGIPCLKADIVQVICMNAITRQTTSFNIVNKGGAAPAILTINIHRR